MQTVTSHFKALIFFLFTTNIHAAVLDYKPLVLPVVSGDQLQIRGFAGDIKLVGVQDARQIQVRVRQTNPDHAPAFAKSVVDEWGFSMHKNGNVLELTVNSPANKRVWQQFLSQPSAMPTFDLEITGPPIGAVIGWRQGRMRIEKWNASLEIVNQDGEVQINGGSGDVRLAVHGAQISIKNRQGQVSVESYSGRVITNSVKGPVQIRNFIGDSTIEDVEGAISLHGFKGQMAVADVKGRIDFNIGETSLKVAKLAGDLKGSSLQGSIQAQVVGGDVRVTTREGSVALELPGSGADVNVGSEDGPLLLPSYLRAQSVGKMRMARGKLRGGNSGSVYVRTASGAIRLR